MNTQLSNELDAVNVMLATIGEAPINDLRKASTSDVSFAQQVLGEQNREVQTEGWAFNTDTDFTLARSGDGTVPIPPNVLRLTVDASNDRSIDPVQRGTRFYDRKAKTYTFAKSIKLSKMVTLLPFTDLPQTARWYITVRAARIFQLRTRGADASLAYSQQDEMNAKRLLRKDYGEAAHLNMLDAPGTADIVNRRQIPRWD